MIRVVGLGQAHAGDDAVGLHVASALAAAPPAGAHVLCLGDPTGLVDLCDGTGPVVVVDAVVGLDDPGTVDVIDPEALRETRATSSHGVSVAQAVGLAAALHGPTRIVIVAVRADGVPVLGAEMSDAVRQAVPHAVRVVRGIVEQLSAEDH